ncbi:hypothetical protein [Endozoicomonas sp. SESOKO1]|uniref:hypothetical protein n=1 Tax=Endozoicomonas sp. SESOKO1 TaxID=2828742 RepID=UPI0021494800|nr:hypothetical protein [Endozoicomonas sp. SESOKO1]
MAIKKKIVHAALLLMLLPLKSFSSAWPFVANYCLQTSAPREMVSRSCPGHIIPSHQTRNFRVEELRCSANHQTHVRLPESFDEEAWQDLKNISRHEAADSLRQQPPPAWTGVINYRTYLHWDWQDCRLVTDEQHCGSYYVCDEIYLPTPDGDMKPVKHCHWEPKTCYADITIHESRYCEDGGGKLAFDVAFLKKDKARWNPDLPGFIDRLANGYDLLPGEEEVITVSNLKNHGRTSQSARLAPTLFIEDPKNEYIFNQHIHNQQPDSLSCRFRGEDEVSFTVTTRNRIASRSPNAFSLPKTFDNEDIDPLVWQSAPGLDGSRKEKGYPLIMRAQDFSAAALNEVSEDVTEKLKNIIVRIQLYEPSLFGDRLKSTIYIDEAKGIQQTLNAISSDQKIRRSTLWEFKLKNGDNPDKNIYRSYVPTLFYYPGKIFLSNEALSYDDQLAPNTIYTLKLTVYQKNLPFYHQSCESDPDAPDCQWYTLWGLFSSNRYEDNYFSGKSLDVRFRSNPNVDQRTWLSSFWHFVGYAQLAVPAGVIAASVFYLL